MKVSVLASGSKGNSTYIESEKTKILIDIGMTSLYIETKLKKLGINPNEIKSIVLTHTHSDHINGLKTFIKKHDVKVYLTEKMYEDIIKLHELNNYQIIDGDFKIEDVNFKVIKTSHDSSDSNGYIIESNQKTISYITDTGYINRKYTDVLKNKNLYIMESNHDVKKLMNGKYPYHLKQRILSDKGHLSNETSSYYLSEYVGNDTKKIILIHLSHENNDPKIALDTIKNVFKEKKINFDNIELSSQEENTEMIEI